MIMLVCSACGGSSADENTETTGISTESSATQVSTYTAYYEKDWGEDPRIWEIQGVFAEGTSPVSDAAPLPLRVFYVTEDNTVTLLKDLYPGDYAYVGSLCADKDFTVSLRVVNAKVFTLPETGSNALAMMPIGLMLCAAVCMGALFVLKKKEI
jgi:LPXTG-motif cell wall-anchored protein